MNFPLSTVVNVSVATPQAGVGTLNTSNVALFTRESYQPSFGDLAFKIYPSGSAGVITDFGSDSVTAQMAVALFSQSRSIRSGSNGGGYLVVIPFLNGVETLTEAIVRTQGLVQYFGIISAEITVDADLETVAAVIQGQPLFGIFPGVDQVDWQPGGRLAKLAANGFTQSRGIAFQSGIELDGLLFSARYISRLMSVDFTGSKTAQTMNMKSLDGQPADPNMDETSETEAMTAGVDVCISLGTGGAGGSTVSKVIISTANGGKVDDVYSQIAMGSDLQVAYFDTLAETETKIPQTEEGMDTIKTALRQVMNQYVTNGVLAPGTWNSPDDFGDREDLLRNVSDLGFYIFSNPIADQLESDRIAGNAPLAQIAAKLAGAVLKGNVLVNLNP